MMLRELKRSRSAMPARLADLAHHAYSAVMAIRQHRSIPLDTSVVARERQIAAYVAMSPEQRVRLAASMSDEVRRLSRDGLLARRSRIRGDPAQADLDETPLDIPKQSR
jgi:hypothetical protein